MKRKQETEDHFAAIPLKTVGPVKVAGPEFDGEVLIPLATFEKPLWPSVNRGARVSVVSGGIRAVIVKDRMTRSVLLEAPTVVEAAEVDAALPGRISGLREIIASHSRFARLVDVHTQVVGNLLFIRFALTTGDAAGHNMATAAAEQGMNWLLKTFPALKYVSLSGNYCVDKKVSAVNGILGRGKHVVAELTVPAQVVSRYLKSTPQKIVDLHIKKNLLGSLAAGSVRSANAHFANMLLAFYLATGQDAANIVEGSQGMVHAEVRDGDLFFTVTLPNLIVGTVGAGKDHAFVRKNLEVLGCTPSAEAGRNARRLAVLCAATVLCGELSLLAALTNPGELMSAHLGMERP
jgi:hydroxymethylglutaryl-CoA reductase (NADPH)